MDIAQVRQLALALPEASEEPHFHFSSFRVKSKIFATVPPDREHLHVFVGEDERERMVALYPEAYEKLWWGRKVVGLRVTLATADTGDVASLLSHAWRQKAPKALQTRLQNGSETPLN